MMKVLACLFDGSEFLEFKKGYGPEIIAGLAKVNGLCAALSPTSRACSQLS